MEERAIDNKTTFIAIIMMALVVILSNVLVQFYLGAFLTYGAFTYPIAFLITDLANRFYGKLLAKKIVYVGFIIGISFTLFFSTNFLSLIHI